MKINVCTECHEVMHSFGPDEPCPICGGIIETFTNELGPKERDALRAQIAACKAQRDALMQMVYDGFTDDPANLCIILGEVEAGQIHDLIAAIDAERKQEVE